MSLVFLLLLSLTGIVLVLAKLHRALGTAPRLSLLKESEHLEHSDLPYVSVIIPTYNESDNLEGCQVMTRLFHRVVRPRATVQTPGAILGGLRVMAVDGTVFDVPDSLENVTGSNKSTVRYPNCG